MYSANYQCKLLFKENSTLCTHSEVSITFKITEKKNIRELTGLLIGNMQFEKRIWTSDVYDFKSDHIQWYMQKKCKKLQTDYEVIQFYNSGLMYESKYSIFM